MKIFVVDDDPVIRSLISDVVSSFGHSVDALSDGSACLEELAKQLPDVVILDYQMPGMSGTEVLREIRAHSRTASIPVIMLSANSDAGQQAPDDCRADCYLQKPFNVMEIAKVLEQPIKRA